MVITRRGGSETEWNEEKQQKKANVGFENKENGKGSSSSSAEGAVASEYEAMRTQRMRENMERMKTLGILDLSKKLKETTTASAKKKKKRATKLATLNDPPRRSSRLQNMTKVSYSELRPPKEEKVITNAEIHIEEGSKPEFYTEEHEKLLGDSKTTWTLFVDGYDNEGQRIYDPFEGKTCHQCRQKTKGHHTKCSKCKLVNGQFCGDCLYMRYGENVIEVNENPDWICPVCRGICNCSRCRRNKGWVPTGAIYRQVHNLGFKSVAHYLIQTHCPQIKAEGSPNKNLVSVDVSLLSADTLPGSSGDKTGAEEKDKQIDADYENMDADNDNDSVDDSEQASKKQKRKYNSKRVSQED